MPINYSDYPDNWKDIRKQVLERDNHQCKWCGVENYAIGFRNMNGDFVPYSEYVDMMGCGIWYEEHFGDNDLPKRIKIILTIAHLGIPKFPCDIGDKTDKMDCRLNNLAALCQKCHLNFDRDEHAKNRQKTAMLKRITATLETGQLPLFKD